MKRRHKKINLKKSVKKHWMLMGVLALFILGFIIFKFSSFTGLLEDGLHGAFWNSLFLLTGGVLIHTYHIHLKRR